MQNVILIYFHVMRLQMANKQNYALLQHQNSRNVESDLTHFSLLEL